MGKSWLNDKTVVISGASGGLGFNVAKILVEKYDCKVIGIARNEEKIKRAIETLEKNKENFSYRIFDVSVRENWVNFAEELKTSKNFPDILINNAGFMLPFARFDKYTDSELDEIVRTNFLSDVYSVRAMLPLLLQSKTPAIVNIASAVSNCPLVGESMYCATKFAVKGFTETLKQDYRGKLYVVGVYPGFIRTNIMGRMSIKEKESKLISHLMKPAESAAKAVVKGIKKRKKSVQIGYDGRLMTFFARIMPTLTPSMITHILKASKLDLFDDIFDFEPKSNVRKKNKN